MFPGYFKLENAEQARKCKRRGVGLDDSFDSLDSRSCNGTMQRARSSSKKQEHHVLLCALGHNAVAMASVDKKSLHHGLYTT